MQIEKERKQETGIVGLGYVGLPLSVEFCKHGFDIYGVDKSPEKIELLRKGKTYIGDVSEVAVKECLEILRGNGFYAKCIDTFQGN